VCDNEPFGRRAPRLARGGGEPLLAKNLARLVEAPAGFDESLLAFHDADAGLGAEFSYLFLRDFHGSFGSLGSRQSVVGSRSDCPLFSTDYRLSTIDYRLPTSLRVVI